MQNLFSKSDSAVIGDYPTNSNVTAAAFAWPTGPGVPPLVNAITFGDNSVTRYAAKALTPALGKTYTLSFYVLMDDLGAPVCGAAGLGTDFFPLVSVAITSGVVVTRMDVTNVYRISYTFVGAGAAINIGIQKLATPNTGPRTFKASGYQIVRANWAGAYAATDAAPIDTGNIRGIS